MIPRILIRTVPAETTPDVEKWWLRAKHLHTGWRFETYRDPISALLFPRTSPHWKRCKTGAQRAGLVRLEALWHHGGVYLDSDVELYRSLDPLLQLQAFAAWEDRHVVPDAVLGAEAHHPAIDEAIDVAVQRIEQGAWASGPGVTTELLTGRPDVLCLPPSTFYPYHYSEKELRSERFDVWPWCYGAHHWAGSWLGEAT